METSRGDTAAATRRAAETNRTRLRRDYSVEKTSGRAIVAARRAYFASEEILEFII